MTIELINEAFSAVIRKRRIWDKIGITLNHLNQLRYLDRTGERQISLEKKIAILQKAGYRFDQVIYTDKDVVDILRFALSVRCSQAARDMGAEYVLEKYKKLPNQR